MHVHPDIEVLVTENKGNGAFAKAAIPAGTSIEISPVIVMTKEERVHLDKTLLHDYIFEWNPEQEQCCMAQGYISVYNHSESANCEYFMNYEAETMEIKTVRPIDANEELTVNYNGDWNNKKPVWFDTVDE